MKCLPVKKTIINSNMKCLCMGSFSIWDMKIYLWHSDQAFKVSIAFIVLSHLTNVHKSNILIFI